MSHHSGWQNLAHASHYMPEEQGEALRKAARWTLIGIGALYVVSALTGFKPGVDTATALLNGNTGKPH